MSADGMNMLGRFSLIGLGILALLLFALNSCLGRSAAPAPTPDAATPIALQAPQILLNPPTGRAGTSVQVTGTGWQPASMVTIRLTDEQGASSLLTASTADEAGQFQVDFLYPLQDRWLQPGAQTVLASVGNGSSTAIAHFTIIENHQATPLFTPTLVLTQPLTATQSVEMTATNTPSATASPTTTPTTQATDTPSPEPTATPAPQPIHVEVAIEIRPDKVNLRKNDMIRVRMSRALKQYGFSAAQIVGESVRFGSRAGLWDDQGAPLRQIKGDDDQLTFLFRSRQGDLRAGDHEACLKGNWLDVNGITNTFWGCADLEVRNRK